MSNSSGTAQPTKAQKGRISFPEPATMNAEQRAVYDEVVSGPRGTLVGPLRAALHNPALADRWQRLGQVLRFETSLPRHLNEIAILVTARRWNSKLEWALHAKDAIRAGLDLAIIDAIRDSRVPDFTTEPKGLVVYEFAQQLVQTGDVTDEAYSALVETWGEVGAVEITAVVGYYSMVAMTLNVHRIPFPEGVSPDLQSNDGSLTSIPSARG